MTTKFITKGKGRGRKVIPIKPTSTKSYKQLKPIYTYTQQQAIADGFLMPNPRMDNFSECNILTTNLYEALVKLAFERTKHRIFELSPDELMGNLMLMAKKVYTEKAFKDDNTKDFFEIPTTEEGLRVWFVRNESGKLTAMLPEDY